MLNSQRNMVGGCTDLDELPTVVWDGKTDIGYNDGSCIPEGVTVTLSGNVTVDGKLCIEGKLIVPFDAKLTITGNAVIVGEDNIVYEGCKHEHVKENIVPATCTEDGSKTVVCEDCGETISTEVIPATGHSFGEWTVTKEAADVYKRQLPLSWAAPITRSAVRAQALPTSQTPSSLARTSPSRAAFARRPRSAPARTASTPTPRPSTT